MMKAASDQPCWLSMWLDLNHVCFKDWVAECCKLFKWLCFVLLSPSGRQHCSGKQEPVYIYIPTSSMRAISYATLLSCVLTQVTHTLPCWCFDCQKKLFSCKKSLFMFISCCGGSWYSIQTSNHDHPTKTNCGGSSHGELGMRVPSKIQTMWQLQSATSSPRPAFETGSGQTPWSTSENWMQHVIGGTTFHLWGSSWRVDCWKMRMETIYFFAFDAKAVGIIQTHG